jgi:hypothetical protein
MTKLVMIDVPQNNIKSWKKDNARIALAYANSARHMTNVLNA